MRFSAALLAVLSAAVGARSSALFGGSGGDDSSVVIRDELDVPGASPLKFCDVVRDDDLIAIEKVDLTPNPPQPGQPLVIEARGTVKEQIEEGAYVSLQVKYGYIRLINTKADLCEQIKNVDLKCPIEKGVISITKSVDLPREIPPGKYTVNADVYSKDDVHITCLNAVVWFKKDATSFLDLEL